MREVSAHGRDRVEPERFGGLSIGEMTSAIRQAAVNEAMGLEALEQMAARQPHRVIASTISDVNTLGRGLAAAHAFLLALAPHEDAIAELLQSARSAG